MLSIIFWIICIVVVVFSIVYFYRRKKAKEKEKTFGADIIGLAPILALLFLFSGMNKRK